MLIKKNKIDMRKEELQNLVDKIQSMTAKEIILAMVESLRIPVTNINMYNWGGKVGNICYGCAATNTICKLGGLDPHQVLHEPEHRDYSVFTERDIEETYHLKMVVRRFEISINYLRMGDIHQYNTFAIRGKFSLIKKPPYPLPYLTNEYTELELKMYEEFANEQ